MTVAIRIASTLDLETYYGRPIDFPVFAMIGEDDGKVTGVGGLGWHSERVWLFFNVEEQCSAFPVIRRAKRLLALAAMLDETHVYATCNDEYTTADKLLKTLGFEPTGEWHEGLRVHQCQV